MKRDSDVRVFHTNRTDMRREEFVETSGVILGDVDTCLDPVVVQGGVVQSDMCTCGWNYIYHRRIKGHFRATFLDVFLIVFDRTFLNVDFI